MQEELNALYQRYRSFMLSIAYAMLGSLADAEDLVQDVFAQGPLAKEPIREPKAYFARLITNRCLNFLGSARKRREVYTGEWLPEPLVMIGDEPAEKLVAKESLSYGLLVLLEHLQPTERAVFVLREAFGMEYANIANIVGKSAANCRQIYSRSTRKLSGRSGSPHMAPAAAEQLAESFIQAAATGNFEPFLSLLADDAVLISDGGGKVRAAIFPIMGKNRIAAFLQGIQAKGSFAGALRAIPFNDSIGLVQIKVGQPVKAINWAWDEKGRISRIYFVLNPDKLNHIPASVTTGDSVLS